MKRKRGLGMLYNFLIVARDKLKFNSKLIQRNLLLTRKGSHFSQRSDFTINSLKGYKPSKHEVPGGGGNIPRDLNFGIFGEAIFEDSDEDEDKVSTIRDDKDKSYFIYGDETNQIMY